LLLKLEWYINEVGFGSVPVAIVPIMDWVSQSNIYLFLAGKTPPITPFWSSLPRHLPSWVSSLKEGLKRWIGVLNPLNEDEKFGRKFLEIGA
jgi:hypothetical protein